MEVLDCEDTLIIRDREGDHRKLITQGEMWDILQLGCMRDPMLKNSL